MRQSARHLRALCQPHRPQQHPLRAGVNSHESKRCHRRLPGDRWEQAGAAGRIRQAPRPPPRGWAGAGGGAEAVLAVNGGLEGRSERLHIFEPQGHKATDRRACFVTIHGGGRPHHAIRERAGLPAGDKRAATAANWSCRKGATTAISYGTAPNTTTPSKRSTFFSPRSVGCQTSEPLPRLPSRSYTVS